ncbi:MIP-2A [Nannizzia gypsea CBS 118893]|uniref:MIP-2A n=1 Tax=Arthroderma gypseum (strain ATCC MYA-4604 / CBS 118893) TaxID=535722 RepID=E4UQ04_ARTGP|nr:MIP-2A [Nannizzia gypsea CBS 118893]EFQ99138.1 MIP-2A [Nannizzia gypsea CBS 118893]
MSYYFTILSSADVPLFSQAFGTSKGGADGIARFRYADNERYMNQFIIHASLDIVEEVQWTNGAMYLKHIDTYPPASAYISAFLTGTGVRFLLLHQPPPSTSQPATGGSGSSGGGGLSASGFLSGASGSSRSSSSSIAHNPTSPQTEDAIRQFMNEVYENWVKAAMSPFYRRGMEITSPVFRARVMAAGKKWL